MLVKIIKLFKNRSAVKVPSTNNVVQQQSSRVWNGLSAARLTGKGKQGLLYVFTKKCSYGLDVTGIENPGFKRSGLLQVYSNMSMVPSKGNGLIFLQIHVFVV